MKNDEAQPSPEAAREEFFRGVEPEAAQNSRAGRKAETERERARRRRTSQGSVHRPFIRAVYTPSLAMGFLEFFRWGLLLQAVAIVHFIRRRPETIWLYVIIFLGGFGALIYIVVEVVPDLGLLRQLFDAHGRRKRIKLLEALVLENPAAGNYEELGDLYLDEQKFGRAKECYDRAIGPRSTDLDPRYRRGIAEISLGDFTAAVTDLEAVTAREPKYDSHRALALLAHAYANSGQTAKAQELFARATEVSTLSETSLNYAAFLASQDRKAEAREWAERILARKATMPRYLQRRERPWFRKAKALLKRL